METYEYHQILKYLYFEGYADSYKDAEELVEELTDEEFDSLYEDVFGIDEGKVEWDNPKRPLQSGLTPREKNRAVRKRLGIENPDTDKPSFFKGGPSEKDYERYGKLKAAHDTEKDKKVPKEKLHKFKPVAKGRLGGEYSAGRIKRMAGVHKGASAGKSAERGTGSSAVLAQVQGSEKIREKRKQRYGDYADLKRLKEPKKSYEMIVNYLLDEGYADDLDSAYVILENMSEGWKTDALKSTLKTAGKVAKYGAKKLNKSKLGKRAKKFATRTVLGAIGIPMIL